MNSLNLVGFNLKKCPFCGNEPSICQTGSTSDGKRLGKEYKIESLCGITLDDVGVVWIDYDPKNGPKIDDSGLIRIIDKWNTRCDG